MIEIAKEAGSMLEVSSVIGKPIFLSPTFRQKGVNSPSSSALLTELNDIWRHERESSSLIIKASV